MTTKKKVAPQDARTFKQICELPRDNVSWGDFTIMFSGERDIHISEHAVGASPTQRLTIPRHVFEKFVRWYQTGSTKR